MLIFNKNTVVIPFIKGILIKIAQFNRICAICEQALEKVLPCNCFCEMVFLLDCLVIFPYFICHFFFVTSRLQIKSIG